LLATHIVTDIEHIADEILLIKNGKIIKKKKRKNLIDEMQQTGKTRTLEDVYFYYLGEKNE
jgi:ABC-type multidrug transport system ATPase subunit